MQVLFATSELAPLIKTGGLADVSHALPQALAELGHTVRVVLPAYRSVMARLDRVERVAEFVIDGERATLIDARVDEFKFGLSLVALGDGFDRAGSPYADEPGALGVGAYRFGGFCRAISSALDAGVWQAQIVHANDWQTGLLCLQTRARRMQKSVFTIHNLAYQGLFDPALLGRLDVGAEHFTLHGIEFHGQASMIKAGIVYADHVTTVSPTYAKEIQTPEFGCGLEGLLRARAADLSGILNGVDVAQWNAADDPYLAAPYDARSFAEKAKNREAVRARFGLRGSDGPIFGLVGRLVYQKGIDWVLAATDTLLMEGGQLVVLGQGDEVYERALVDLAQQRRGLVGVQLGFDEGLAHLIEGGCDFFLMPSRYEPCGLNQMYSMRYGTPPIVHRTGGLADTVIDADGDPQSGTGFAFDAGEGVGGFADAILRARRCFADHHRYLTVARRGMAFDCGWTASARRYEALYLRLL